MGVPGGALMSFFCMTRFFHILLPKIDLDVLNTDTCNIRTMSNRTFSSPGQMFPHFTSTHSVAIIIKKQS